MLKINYYHLPFLSALFCVNSSNIFCSSPRQLSNTSLSLADSPTSSIVPSQWHFINNSTYSENSVSINDFSQAMPQNERNANNLQGQTSYFSDILKRYPDAININNLNSFNTSTATAAAYQALGIKPIGIDNSTSTFMLRGFSLNNSTNTFNRNNVSMPIPNDNENFNNGFANMNSNITPSVVPQLQMQQVTNHPTATAQSGQSSLSSIDQRIENNNNIRSLFPSSNITPQPYNWPNSSTNTFIPPFILSNNSTSTFANIHNNNLFMELDSANFNDAFANTNQDKQCALYEKNKKDRRPKTYTCPTCHKNLANRSSYKYHIGTHDPNRPKPHQCNICHKRFSTKSILNNHAKRHNTEKPFLCNFCSKRFTTKYERTRHHRTHTGEKPYLCKICNKRFTTKEQLKLHNKNHTGEKPFKCDFCDKCFKTKTIKLGHHRTHTGEKPYTCNICQKGLATKGTLEDHLNRHKGKKLYKCTQCTKAYATKDGLKYHIKTHNKPYMCHYCDADFAHKKEYEKHIRYHKETDEDCKCHRCKKVYSNKYNLQQHKKKAHSKT